MFARRITTRGLNKAARLSARLFRYIYTYANAGSNVLCALCGWNGRSFYNKKCPKCNSFARHRLIPYSMSYFDLNFNQKVLLHVGPNMEESGWISKQLKLKKYLGFDLKEKKNLTNLVGDLEAIPLVSETIDYVLIWHVLEHIPNDHSVIQEMRRVLRNGGSVIVSVPIFPPDRVQTLEDPDVTRENYQDVYGHFDHVRACGLDYGDRFKAAGFEVRELRVKTLSKQSETELYGLSPSHVAWCCTKV
jgi:SAM-dependent methyltransferase